MTPNKRSRLKKVRLTEISLVDAGAHPEAVVSIYKRDIPGGEPHQQKGPTMDANTQAALAEIERANATISELTANVAKLRADLDAERTAREAAEAKVAQVAKAAGGAPAAADPAEDEILKNADPAVRDVIVALRKSNADAHAQIQKLAEEGEVRKAIAHVTAEFPNLPVKAEDFGPVFKRLSAAMKKDDLDVLTRVLKAASETAAMLLTGAGGTGVTIVKSSAEAQMETLAKARSERTGEAYAVAYDKVMQENPGLYSRYIAERNASMN